MTTSTADLLKIWGFENLISIFEENEIDIDILLSLDDKNLEYLVPKVGQRIKFKKCIAEYNNEKDVRENSTILAEIPVENFSVDVDNSLISSTPLSTDSHLNLITLPGTPSTSSTPTQSIIYIPDFQKEIENYEPVVKRKKSSNFNLKDVLNSSCIGRAILNVYESTHLLDSKCQSYLVDLIALHFLNGDYNRLTNEDFKNISQEIVNLFPNEKLEVYYSPPVRKRDSKTQKSGVARGKLVDKYRNKVTFLRQAKIIPYLRDSCENSDDSEENSLETDPTNNQEYIWLKNNHEPWTDVIEKWQQCHDYRRNYLKKELTITDIYNDWPILSNNLGYTLIDKDFEKTWPEKSEIIFTKWNSIFNAVLNLRKKTLNQSDTLLIDIVNSRNINEEYRYYLTICLLCSLIPCKARVITKGKSQWKPTVEESREGIICRVEICADIPDIINKKKEKFGRLGIPLQPFVIVEIADNTNIKNVYVSVHDTLYKLSSILKAVDISFKFFQILNLSYPAESEHLWLFIQYAMYDLKTKYDNKIPTVLDIVNKVSLVL